MNVPTHRRELFTVKAALEYLAERGLDVPKPTFYRWIKAGDIAVIRPTPTCRNIKIERAELDMLVTPH